MVQLILTTQQTQVRCLNLWNGIDNNPAPTGWEQPGFDDSGWSLSANPNLISEGGFPVYISKGYSPNQNNVGLAALPSDVQAVWPTSSMQNVGQYAILRWHFNWPSVYTVSNQITYGPSAEGAFTFTNTVYINGSLRQNLFDEQGNLGGVRSDLAGLSGDTVFAVGKWGNHFDPTVGGSDLGHLAWVSSAWFGLKIILDATQTTRGFAQVVG